MPRPKKVQAPHLSAFKYGNAPDPAALNRERTTQNQVWHTEDIIIWGEDNALPLRQLNAIDESPTATSCLGTVENFIKGSRFSDEGLMTMVINKDGETLWDLHSKLCEYMSKLEGFSTQFTYSAGRKITNAYAIGTESCRFMNPAEGSRQITKIKYNPYFGTTEYQNKYTSTYDVFNLNTIGEGVKTHGISYNGQIYFYGKVRPLYRFYPVPKYWSGQWWIYVDGKIQRFHGKNLDNGFFQSVWMQVVGNPNAESQNPKYNKTETGTDGTKRKKSTKTVGEEFDERMSEMFSGSDKAGTAFVSWVANKDNIIDLQAFPVNTNFDVMSGTLTDAIRGITIATEVPAILANLPQQASSLGSDGNAIKAAIDLMQSRVTDRQQILTNFYNNVLLKNFEARTKAQVKIMNFIPITTQVTVDKLFWDEVPKEDRIKFINEHVPGIEITVTEPAPAEPQVDEEGNVIEPPKVNEALKNLTLRDFDRIAGVKRRFQAGKMGAEEVKSIMMSYGYTEEEINTWLQQQQTEV